MTYRECYEWGKLVLGRGGISEAGLDARLLLEYACRLDFNGLLTHGEETVPDDAAEAYGELVRKRAERVPLQLLTGEQCFMGLDFLVNENVLIPRQDTETLVEEVLRELEDGMRILDLCTGSGCILVSLLHYSNGCLGVGADLSGSALAVARENGRRILGEAWGAAEFLQSDLFEGISGKFDRIVSNPPYIARNDIPGLMPEVRDYEPRMALDGGEDGLYFYRRIIDGSRDYLEREGRLYLEIGCGQGAAVTELMEQAGFRDVRVVQDLAGLDRVVCGIFL